MTNTRLIIEELMEKLELEIEDYVEMDEIAEIAYMMTQYENGGVINVDSYLRELFDENYDVEDFMGYYSDYANYDDMIYSMSEFDEIMRDEKPIDVAFKIHFGDFNPNHDYFMFDGYANLKSSDYISDLIDENGFKEYLIEHSEDYNDLDIINGFKDNQDAFVKLALELVNRGY